MNKRHHFLMRLFILLFTVSVSVTVIPCNSINVIGLFGEIKSSSVINDNKIYEAKEKQVYIKSHKNKGINIINIWYELRCSIVCMIFIMYLSRLPRGDTIITFKVRMDN